jgi:hypothetical protein
MNKNAVPIPEDLRELHAEYVSGSVEVVRFTRIGSWRQTTILVCVLGNLIERIAALTAQLKGCAIAARSYAEGVEYGTASGYGDEFKAVLTCRQALDSEIKVAKELRERLEAVSIAHNCDLTLRQMYPDQAQASDGEKWTCICGKVWVHVCDEAEGCSWEEAQRGTQ